jgi:hypothetical protein
MNLLKTSHMNKIFLGLLSSLVFFSTPCIAENTKFDLYSWAKPNAPSQWCFSLMPASKDPVSTAAIKSNKEQICGQHDVKRLMGQSIPEGGKVAWKTNEAEGLILPTNEIVNDLKRFASTMDFKLETAKGSSVKSDAWK